MKIRIIAIITFLVCNLFSFAQKEPGFIINGHIDSIKNGAMVYLYNIEEQVKMDSAICSNGDFILKGYVEKPACCWLLCEGNFGANDTYTIIQVENTKMKYWATLKNMYLGAVVTGGNEQDLQNKLNKLQHPYDMVWATAKDSIVKNLYTDDRQKRRLEETVNRYIDSSMKIYVEFGKRHPNSYLGLDIIYRSRQQIGKDTVAFFLNQLNNTFKATAKAQALKIFIGTLAQKGEKFIDFEAKTIQGNNFRLSSLKGKYIYLSFWSAGCGPCRMENEDISQNYNQVKDKISFVSFAVDKNRLAWDIASRQDSICWTNVSDLEGENGKVKTQYDVQGIPASFLIDKEGTIIERFDGFDDDLLYRLKNLTAENKTDTKKFLYGYKVVGDEVIFTYALPAKEDINSIKNITVAGSFNNWQPDDLNYKLVLKDNRVFELALPKSHFAKDREYTFKFVINGTIWVDVPEDALNVDNGRYGNLTLELK